MKSTLKILIPIILLFAYTQPAFADIVSGVSNTTEEVQKIGLGIAGLFGVIGAVMMAYNPEGGTQKASYALFAAAAIGVMPSLVATIGGFF